MASWLKIFEDHRLYRHDTARLFDDWLTMVLCCLANQRQEELYLATAKRYDRAELDTMAKLFAELILIHEQLQPERGWYDALGTIYELLASRSKASRMGQFFTPAEVCEVMARITMGEDPRGTSLADPCCGSGRQLLAGYVHGRKFLKLVVGADLDPICAKMCALNFWLHGITGEVACMNSLSQEWYHAYVVHPRKTYPFVVFLDEERKEESVLYRQRVQFSEPVATPPVFDLFSQPG